MTGPSYGPTPLPGMELAPWTFPEAPGLWIGTIALGILITAMAAIRRLPESLRAAAFCFGQTLVLTTPLGLAIERWAYGAFPTIDKAGSLFFYLGGVHRRMVLDPAGSLHDPAAALIGVQVGHLWVTALFDTVLSPFGAMNAQALVYPAFGWWACSRLCREVVDDPRVAIVAGFPFGLGLHVFRDLHWYTIEKAAIGWLALAAWLGLRSIVRGRGTILAGVALLVAAWMNLYLGLVGAAMVALAVPVCAGVEGFRGERTKTTVRLFVSAFLWLLPLAVWQGLLLRYGAPVRTPEAFLWERAALDAFSIWPLAWDRIELWRALDPLALVAFVFGVRAWARSRWVIPVLLAAGVLLLLAVGPLLLTEPRVESPLYRIVRWVLPGFWRVAKPEVFFEGTWLVMLVFAARGLQALGLGGARAPVAYALVVAAWLGLTRSHPAYPGFSIQKAIQPVEHWEEGVLR